MLCSTSWRRRVPVSGAASMVTEAATRPGSCPRSASHAPQWATRLSTSEASTKAAPSDAAAITAVT